jgi:hypothetical protein
LAELVRRAETGESVVGNLSVVETTQTNEDEIEKKVDALAKMICRTGDEAKIKSAALLVLMSTIEEAMFPKALANVAKHLAFTPCGELNVYRMIDAPMAMLESELMVSAGATP